MIRFFANVYLIDYEGDDRDALEEKAAMAASGVLLAADIPFEDVMVAHGARINGEDFNEDDDAAYEAALAAAQEAIAEDITDSGVTLRLTWR
ncbi:MAG: hypothetical protein VB101_09960 [Rhodospirillaceae bacterium]|nr:hypothetical protein [Rhodospirillaceae bacterium]